MQKDDLSTLTPHEILLSLGFKIPAEGLKINPNDKLLHTESLKLLGKTMNVESIPKEDLMVLHSRVKQQGKDTIPNLHEDSVAKLRALIESIIRCFYKEDNI